MVDYKMKAEPGGIINRPQIVNQQIKREGKKHFSIRFDTNELGEVNVSVNNQGFHPYEIVGFLEVAKADQVRIINESFKK